MAQGLHLSQRLSQPLRQVWSLCHALILNLSGSDTRKSWHEYGSQHPRRPCPTQAVGGTALPPDSALIHRVQAIAHGEGELLRMVGLLQVIEVAAKDKIVPHHVRAVAAGKNHLQLWPVTKSFSASSLPF